MLSRQNSVFIIFIIKRTSLFACVFAILSKGMQVGYFSILLLFIVFISRFVFSYYYLLLLCLAMLFVFIILYCFYYAWDKALAVPKVKIPIKTMAYGFFGFAYSDLELKVVTICAELCYPTNIVVTGGGVSELP